MKIKMLNNFILITKNESIEIDLFKEFLSSLFVKFELKEYDDYYLVLHDNNDDESILEEAFNSYICDITSNIKVYVGYSDNEASMIDEIEVVKKYFNLELVNSIYNKKTLLNEVINVVSEDFKKVVLKKYYEDYEMQNILKAFFVNNMNTMKSAKLLYIHRNTLINKLQRFKEITGFDPKEFKDAYLIYSLIK